VDEIKETRRMLWWEISSFVELMEYHVHNEALPLPNYITNNSLLLKLAKNYITNNLHEQITLPLCEKLHEQKEKNSKKHFQSSIAIDVPLIFKDSFSISLQDDILEAQRLTQRDQGRGPSLQKQKDQQHLPCETSRNKKKNQHNLLSTPFLNISEKFK
jgi:hypothetical protein